MFLQAFSPDPSRDETCLSPRYNTVKTSLLPNKPKEEQDLSWREVAILLPPRCDQSQQDGCQAEVCNLLGQEGLAL